MHGVFGKGSMAWEGTVCILVFSSDIAQTKNSGNKMGKKKEFVGGI